MLKLNYFLADIFILSAEKQPIKLSWRKIEWLPILVQPYTMCDMMFSFVVIRTVVQDSHGTIELFHKYQPNHLV